LSGDYDNFGEEVVPPFGGLWTEPFIQSIINFSRKESTSTARTVEREGYRTNDFGRCGGKKDRQFPETKEACPLYFNFILSCS
jgi:hypothetical protein